MEIKLSESEIIRALSEFVAKKIGVDKSAIEPNNCWFDALAESGKAVAEVCDVRFRCAVKIDD